MTAGPNRPWNRLAGILDVLQSQRLSSVRRQFGPVNLRDRFLGAEAPGRAASGNDPSRKRIQNPRPGAVGPGSRRHGAAPARF
jgi:hypothetical protein